MRTIDEDGLKEALAASRQKWHIYTPCGVLSGVVSSWLSTGHKREPVGFTYRCGASETCRLHWPGYGTRKRLRVSHILYRTLTGRNGKATLLQIAAAPVSSGGDQAGLSIRCGWDGRAVPFEPGKGSEPG